MAILQLPIGRGAATGAETGAETGADGVPETGAGTDVGGCGFGMQTEFQVSSKAKYDQNFIHGTPSLQMTSLCEGQKQGDPKVWFPSNPRSVRQRQRLSIQATSIQS